MTSMRGASFLATAALIGALSAGSAASAAVSQTAVAQAGTAAARSGGTWHQALPVKGPSGEADVSLNSVSCPSPGDCTAGGSYAAGGSAGYQAMVVSEHAGHWTRPIELPGTAALNSGHNARVASVSCASPGNCAADGQYETSSGQGQMFVVSEVAGRWGQAHAIPGRPAVDNGFAQDSLSCPSAGNCVAGGFFITTRDGMGAFVVDETDGHWGKRVLLTGAGLRAAFVAEVEAVTCTSAGNCTASGTVLGNSGTDLFAVSETNGHWGRATTISPSGITIVTDGFTIDSMSCSAPGDCAVGGSYAYKVPNQGADSDQPFVLSEVGGHWGSAMDVPGLTRPAKNGLGEIDSVSCVPPGTCTAGGSYTGPGHSTAFVVTETGGTWGNAMRIARSDQSRPGNNADLTSVSCTSPGNCEAGGFVLRLHPGWQAFVVTESGGHWGPLQSIPGLAKLDKGNLARINSISCASAGHCAAVGNYDTFLAFAATES